MKETLTTSSDQKRKKLKSKQTYLSSQNKNKEEKLIAQKTVEMALEELDAIWHDIDNLYKLKLLHEQTNKTSIEDISISVNILLNKQTELTDCIYGIIQYIQEQSYKMKQRNKFKKQQNLKVKTFIETGKTLAPIQHQSSEDSEEDPITFTDIVNYFPYLKSLETQLLSPSDYYLYQPLS